MKIIVKHEPIDDIEITIQCKEDDPKLDSIINSLKLIDLTLTGKIEDRQFKIDARRIYYFESVDDKVFCYTQSDVYETKYRLYELENILPKNFIRVSRTTVLNLRKIQSFKSILSGRIECLLKNKEKVFISRNYVKRLKQNLGVYRGEHK
ncbi:MAG: LytTR family DNA-binding domain-containing protein [Bacillota bacterium]